MPGPHMLTPPPNHATSVRHYCPLYATAGYVLYSPPRWSDDDTCNPFLVPPPRSSRAAQLGGHGTKRTRWEWHAATTNNTTTRSAPRTARGDRARHITAGRYDHVWTGGRTTTTGTAIHRQHEPSMKMIRFVDEHALAQPQRAPRNMRAATNTKLITREDHRTQPETQCGAGKYPPDDNVRHRGWVRPRRGGMTEHEAS